MWGALVVPDFKCESAPYILWIETISVRLGVIVSDLKDLRNELRTWSTFYLNNDLQWVSDIPLNRGIWHFDTALQNAPRET